MLSIVTQNTTAVITIFAFAVGISAALLSWLISRSIAEVPAENREYKDKPPVGFRLTWWPIHWLSHFIGPMLSTKTQIAVQNKLIKSGLEYTVTPAQFFAAKLLCAGISVIFFYWAIGSFDSGGKGRPGLSIGFYLQGCMIGAALGYIYPSIWLRERLTARRRELLKALPFYLDVITLCVEAGLNVQGALQQAVAKGPKGVLCNEIQRVLRDIRAGNPRADSLRAMAERLNETNVTSVTTAIIQAEKMGMNLGPVLRAQADQRRSERFLRAEKLAMEAPVKLLFPLIAFIFPCTFIVLFFPIAMKFMHAL